MNILVVQESGTVESYIETSWIEFGDYGLDHFFGHGGGFKPCDPSFPHLFTFNIFSNVELRDEYRFR